MTVSAYTAMEALGRGDLRDQGRLVICPVIVRRHIRLFTILPLAFQTWGFELGQLQIWIVGPSTWTRQDRMHQASFATSENSIYRWVSW